MPLFGRVELLRLVLSEERIDRVVVAFGVTRESEMLETIRTCEDAAVDIHILPRFFELGVAVDGRDVDDIWGIPLVRLPRSRLQNLPWLGKRVLDVSVAGIGLVVLAPLYLLLALAVKLSSPGAGSLPPKASGPTRGTRGRLQIPDDVPPRGQRRRVDGPGRARHQGRERHEACEPGRDPAAVEHHPWGHVAGRSPSRAPVTSWSTSSLACPTTMLVTVYPLV